MSTNIDLPFIMFSFECCFIIMYVITELINQLRRRIENDQSIKTPIDTNINQPPDNNTFTSQIVIEKAPQTDDIELQREMSLKVVVISKRFFCCLANFNC